MFYFFQPYVLFKFCFSMQGFRGVLKSLKLYKNVLIMISRGLKFGDGKTRIAIMAECDN